MNNWLGFLFLNLVLLAVIAVSATAQEIDPTKRIAELEERLTNSIKASVAKDAEITKLRLAVSQSPDAITKIVATRTQELNALKSSVAVQACKAAKGKALITSDGNGQLVYAGCLL